MKDTENQPLTPDFDVWPVQHPVRQAAAAGGALAVTWADGRTSMHHPLLLAENDPSPDSLHPLSRETTLSPLDLPVDLAVAGAEALPDGSVRITWSHGRRASTFHPGWLRGTAWFEDAPATPGPVLWTGEEQPEPPTFSGPEALKDPAVWRAWLAALRDYGVARLEGLPDEDGLLMSLVEKIGTIRESNFGKMYTLAIKDDPDSNAFTPDALLQHIDMPTRECPHGLQFLFCRRNTASGGEGIYADAYRIAEDLRREEPEMFEALCSIPWTYNNRSRSSSYQASGPVIECGAAGEITGVRYNTWLRAPLCAPLEVQDLAYRSYRAFARRAQDPRYQMVFSYRAGDLLAFDNRRALHGRNGYDAKGGSRFIEGIYADRDDLHSAIRMADRHLNQEQPE